MSAVLAPRQPQPQPQPLENAAALIDGLCDAAWLVDAAELRLCAANRETELRAVLPDDGAHCVPIGATSGGRVATRCGAFGMMRSIRVKSRKSL